MVIKNWIVAVFVLVFALITTAPRAHAVADKQSFAGGDLGVLVYSHEGSGSGFWFNGYAGYSFSSAVGLGFHAGYANVGTVGIGVLAFGPYLQLTEADSGFYVKLLVDVARAEVSGGVSRYGVSGSEFGAAPGVAAGFLIPSMGDMHFVPELSYKYAFFTSAVHLFSASVGMMWDF